MRRRSTTKYLLTMGLLSLGSLALTVSCADNNSSLFVVGVIDINSSACIAKNDTTSAMLSQGTMDYAFTSSYTAAVLVGNQLTQRGSREELRTETSRVSLRGAEVTLTTLDGKEIGHYSTVGTGFIDPSSGTAPGYAAMYVNVIPPSLGVSDAVRNAGFVLAKIRVFGDSLGNVSVTSSELDFPIRICQGCLVRYPAASNDPAAAKANTYSCTRSASTTQTTTETAPCLLGQDQPFDCTLCSSTTIALCADPTQNPSFSPTP